MQNRLDGWPNRCNMCSAEWHLAPVQANPNPIFLSLLRALEFGLFSNGQEQGFTHILPTKKLRLKRSRLDGRFGLRLRYQLLRGPGF